MHAPSPPPLPCVVVFFKVKLSSTRSLAEHLTTRCFSARGSSAVPLRLNSNMTGVVLSLVSARTSFDVISSSQTHRGLKVKGYDACRFACEGATERLASGGRGHTTLIVDGIDLCVEQLGIITNASPCQHVDLAVFPLSNVHSL